MGSCNTIDIISVGLCGICQVYSSIDIHWLHRVLHGLTFSIFQFLPPECPRQFCGAVTFNSGYSWRVKLRVALLHLTLQASPSTSDANHWYVALSTSGRCSHGWPWNFQRTFGAWENRRRLQLLKSDAGRSWSKPGRVHSDTVTMQGETYHPCICLCQHVADLEGILVWCWNILKKYRMKEALPQEEKVSSRWK